MELDSFRCLHYAPRDSTIDLNIVLDDYNLL
jgi:hypothetical protein